MSGYYFDDKKRFIIDDYHKAKTFSSFLPGIAGKDGIPVWAFYVNRGQGISSFGIRDKKSPIMEFYPANAAYQTVTTNGFRTFIRETGAPEKVVEPFSSLDAGCQRRMGIEKDSFFVEEVNETTGLTVKVAYTTLTNQPFGGLVRQVTLTNDTDAGKELEIVDGMPALLPFGIANDDYKAMSNLLQSWMEVSGRQGKVPFYKLRSSTADASVVSEIKAGCFYLSEAVADDEVLNIYDPNLVFDYQLDLRVPVGFIKSTKEELMAKDQVFANKVPAAFQLVTKTLDAGASVTINSVVGYSDSYDLVVDFAQNMAIEAFVAEQFQSAKAEIDTICDDMVTETGLPIFDEYIRQSYLDNVLRGGKPYLFEGEDGPHVYHIFSRKHGDLERDYNFFSLEPSKYSQGNGNYRDVNQNRRNDVVMNPEVGDFNIWMFYNLVQADGYNPLSIKGTTFSVKEDRVEALEAALSAEGVTCDKLEDLMAFAKGTFTPGSLMTKLDSMELGDQKIFDAVLKPAVQDLDVAFGEGFWSDHFTYNLDLVKSYRYIYPDQMEDLFFERKDYRFYNAPYEVLPRDRKYGLSEAGTVRQYESIAKKENFAGDWLTDETGQVVYTDLFNKMMTLVLTKTLNLDPFGMGIEMEGDKPGWNDALNGLPGLFGSGMSETLELKRHIDFMLDVLGSDVKRHELDLLKETARLIKDLTQVIDQASDAFDRWNQLNEVKDSYRAVTGSRMTSENETVSMEAVKAVLKAISDLLDKGIDQALEIGDGLMPSYFINEVTDYELLDTKTDFGLPAVKVKAFKNRRLPFFLEGPARYMKTLEGDRASELHSKVLASGIYDKGLGMFKTSESLDDESMEIGRIRAFTPGWLERESVFLHMTYKYLLSLLESGQYDAFYKAAKTNMIPFLDPEVYGRPTTENSSFIASSRNPNPAVVGQGFVARLSGSTAEIISMWIRMFVGENGFTYDEKGLKFEFAPKLTGEFFDAKGQVSFKLFGYTKVTYVNPEGKATFGDGAAAIGKIVVDGVEEAGTCLGNESAMKLRAKKIKKIKVYFI